MNGHENVRGLEVAVNYSLLMGMLDGLANSDEELQPFLRGELMAVAIIVDGDAVHEFHDEKRPSCLGRSGIEHPCDIRVIHNR